MSSLRVRLVITPKAGRAQPQPASRDFDELGAGTLVGYCDGGYQRAGADGQRRWVDRAGWGFVIVAVGWPGTDRYDYEICDGCGPVVLEEDDPCFIGAPRATNNTAELAGMYELLIRMTRHVHEHGPGAARTVVLRPDSAYSYDAALVLHGGGVNAEMTATVRTAYLALRAALGDGGRILMHKVKGHSGNRWNDRADALATRGVQGEVGNQGGAWDRRGAWEADAYSTVGRWVALVRRRVNIQREGDHVILFLVSMPLDPHHGHRWSSCGYLQVA